MIKSANGVTGHLISCMDNTYMFRVYDYTVEPATFIDYNLRHSDLIVTINDRDAAFYSKCNSHVLDHSPDTLGIKE